MDSRPTANARRQRIKDFDENSASRNIIARQRLNSLLEINAKTALEKTMYKSELEKLEGSLMRRPLDANKTFSYFGLMLGTFPPAAIFAKLLFNASEFRKEQIWILGIILIINSITAVVGYFSGKLIGKMVKESESYNWLSMILLLPLIGIFWGVMAGGAGGVIVFFFGALFGALFGAMVGAAALPVFTIFHRLLKKDEMIEHKHFLPLAFGVTFTICAFILGL